MEYRLHDGIPEYPKHSVMGLVSFKVLNIDNEQIYQVNTIGKSKTTIKLNVIANILPSFLDTLNENSIARVYLEVTAPDAQGAVVVSQYIDLPISKIKKENTNLVNLTYEFDVPSVLTVKRGTENDPTFTLSAIDIRLAFSNKSHHQMGIGETLRIGTFLSTRIMVDQHE